MRLKRKVIQPHSLFTVVQGEDIVIGGGNAGLSAAIELASLGRKVKVLEAAPKFYRGGNSKYTRDIRYAHDNDRFTSGSYSESELLSDLKSVSGQLPDEKMASLVVDMSREMPYWMEKHGIRFKQEIKGTLDLSRTNAFFLGGGKALMDAYYQWADHLGISIVYDAKVTDIKLQGNRCSKIETMVMGKATEMASENFIIASGGFESNRKWLEEIWGPGSRNFRIRGTSYNMGEPLRSMIDHGAVIVGDPRGGHIIAVDDRAPEYDGGIVTRIDAIPKGIVVNKNCRRFYDEGEDIWPKRYAIWGKLVAGQEEQIAYVITDSAVRGHYMPTAFPPYVDSDIGNLAVKVGLNRADLERTVREFNDHVSCEPSPEDGNFSCHTEGLLPPKSHWASPIIKPPFYAYRLRPGLTFTYMGLKIDYHGRIVTGDGPIENCYAAGEIASGNILKSGYLAGFGLTIGCTTAWLSARDICNAA